jgi:rod shape-determining protein MreD
MRIVAHVAVAWLLLVAVGALWRLTPFEVVMPDLVLIFAVYLGITGRGWVFHAVAAVVVMGWLADVLAGAPRGLTSVVAGVVCVLCRVVSTRLLLRGRLFIATFTLVAALFANLLAFGLRAFFGGVFSTMGNELFVLAGQVLLTALVSPLVFTICRRIDALFARTEREREAVREGYLS